jgi:hypothetical protein
VLDQFVQQLQYVRFLGDPFHTAPSASTQIIYKTEWTATMHAYRNCVKLIQRIDREYKFEILDTERKQDKSVEGTHFALKLKRWEEVADEALENGKQFTDFKRMKTEIQNCNDAIFSGGINAINITKLYSDFSELMHSSLQDQYYQPPLDPRYYEPFVYEPEFIKSKTEWRDCLAEIGKYMMYLEEYNVLHAGFARFRNDMVESAQSEQREEKESPDEGSYHLAHMSGMLSRLNNLSNS